MKPTKVSFRLTIVAGLLCAAGVVRAQTIPVVNASFELPAGAQGTVAGVPYGWVPSNGDPYGVYNPAAGVYANESGDTLPSPAQGAQVLWMNGGNYVAQFLTNTLVAGQTYTLSGAIGNRGDGYGMLPADQEYVELVAGSTIIAQNLNLHHPTPGSFQSWSITYTAPTAGFPTGALQIRLGQNGSGEVNYDNIVFSGGSGTDNGNSNVVSTNITSTNTGTTVPIAVLDSSFESPAGAQGTAAGVPFGWLPSNGDPYGVYNPPVGAYANEVSDILPSPADGSQVLWMNGGNYVAQFLTNTLVANQTYTLSGAIGNRGDGYGMLPTDQEYVELVAGSTIIADNVNLPHPAPGSFQSWTITYTAPAAGFPTGALQIRLGQNGSGEVNYDNITLTTTGVGQTTVTPSTTAVTSSQNPALVGSVVTFTATVSESAGIPAGTVAFLDGSNQLATETLNSSGLATFSTSTLSVAGSPHGITAVYGGSSSIGSSTSGVLAQVITNAGSVTLTPSTTAVASSQNPALAGSVVTFTATVSGSNGVPTGIVTFYDGGAELGIESLNTSGMAALGTTAPSASGSPYSITAVYGGDTVFSGSTSSVLSQIVTNSSSTNSSGQLWSLTQRPSYTLIPGAAFRPTGTNSTMAVDEMPNGSPADAGNGVIWQDWCLEDCYLNNATTVHVIHLAPHPNFMEISSQVYNGTNPLPLLMGQGLGSAASTIWAVAISNNVFYPLNGMGGVANGSSAPAGVVGEYIAGSLPIGSAVSLTNGVTANAAGLYLTAGDWDVEGVVHFNIVAGTVSSSSAAISIVSAAIPADGSAVASGLQLVGTSTFNSIPIPRKQINITSTTAVYLVGTCYFSQGSVYTYGQITARRMR